MNRISLRNIVPLCFLLFAITASPRGHSEPMTFSYTFTTDFFGQIPYGPESKLFGQIDGTVDPIDPNRVIINSFGTVSLSRPGFLLHSFESIDVNEFNTYPSGNTPVMSFDGTGIDFRACPSGFTDPDTGPPFDDCPFAEEGGFLVVSVADFNPTGFVTAADGFGAAGTEACGVPGCRVSEFGVMPASWSLALLPDGVDPSVVIDPTVTIGANTSVSEGVVLEENVELGNNVAVNKNTSIGSNTTVGNNVILNKDGDVGSSVIIGDNVTIAQRVVIEGGVVIEDGTIINRGVYICSGITIGSAVTIGKNQLVNENVPSTGEIPGTNTLPNPADCL